MDYKIGCTDFFVIVSSMGAELRSIKKNNHEYLWQGDPRWWEKRAPVLFPAIGYHAEEEFVYKGKTYSMPKHGTARSSEFEVELIEHDRIEFSYKILESMYYPFSLKLYVCYQVKNKALITSYRVENLGSEAYFCLGFHPAFILEDYGKKRYEILFKEALLLPELLNSKGVLVESEHSNKTCQRIDITNETFKDDALVFKNSFCNEVSLLVDDNLLLKFSNINESHIGLWSPVGAPFICIEPWGGVPDYAGSTNDISKKKGAIFLDNSSVYTSSFLIEFFI